LDLLGVEDMKVILRQVGLAEEWLKVFQKQRLNNLETVHTVGESVLLSQMQDEKGGKIKFGQLRALFLVIESIGRKQGMGGGGGMKQGAASWSVGQVVAHLKQQGHESLAKLCDVHAISGAVLLSLKDEDFGALGFESLGDIAVMKRVLKDLKQQQQQQQQGECEFGVERMRISEIPDDMLCPISHEIMQDPVMAMDGHTYERSRIEEWFRSHNTSPMTREAISTQLLPNITVKKRINDWKERNQRK